MLERNQVRCDQSCLSRRDKRDLSTIWKQLEPLVCLLCVVAGVLIGTWLPSTLMAETASSTIVTIASSPWAAIPIGFVIFKLRAYKRWRAAHASPLTARMLSAIAEGVMWPTIIVTLTNASK